LDKIFFSLSFHSQYFFSTKEKMKRLFSVSSVRRPQIAPFAVFQPTGMLMAKPVPLTLSSEGESSAIAREGYVALTLLPRSAEAESKGFDKEKRMTIKLRAKQMGQIIAWKLNGNHRVSPLNFTAYAGLSSLVNVEIKPVTASAQGEDEPVVQLTVTPKQTPDSSNSASPTPFSMPIPVGEMRAFQVLLEACLPTLFGWVPKNTTSGFGTAAKTTKSPEEFFKQFHQ